MKRLDLLLLSASAIAFSGPLVCEITPEMMGYDATDSMEGIDLGSFEDGAAFDEEQFKQILMQLQAQMSPEMQRDLEQREEERKELGLKLNTLQNELAELELIKASIKIELSEMIDRLAVAMSDQMELNGKLEQLVQETEAMGEEEGAELRAELEERELDLRELAGEIDLLQEAIEEKRLAKLEIKVKIEAHLASIADLEAAMNKVDAVPHIDFASIFGDAVDADSEQGFENNIEPSEGDPYGLVESDENAGQEESSVDGSRIAEELAVVGL
ncbi:MAG: hypothetical protein QG632_665 [Candidatus Dependentiae bacterium]|nr:hypothetical protein [Candidatus Dependentiae bacterium]